jgi:hypothetical protein
MGRQGRIPVEMGLLGGRFLHSGADPLRNPVETSLSKYLLAQEASRPNRL